MCLSLLGYSPENSASIPVPEADCYFTVSATLWLQQGDHACINRQLTDECALLYEGLHRWPCLLEVSLSNLRHAANLLIKDVVGGGRGCSKRANDQGSFKQTHIHRQTSTLTFRGSACGSVYDQRGKGRPFSEQ